MGLSHSLARWGLLKGKLNILKCLRAYLSKDGFELGHTGIGQELGGDFYREKAAKQGHYLLAVT